MGVLFEGGNKFRPGGEIVDIFYPKVCLFMLFNDEIFPLLLIKSIFIGVKFVIIQN